MFDSQCQCQCPAVYAEFLKGKFAMKKSRDAFSVIAIDQAREAVGLTENQAALRRWMVSGPEKASVIGEFEGSIQKKKDMDHRHHEQNRHAQKAFARDVQFLSATIEEMGNPFCESSSDLLVLDSRNIADSAVADTVFLIEKLGLDHYETYMNEWLVTQTVRISDPIKRNNLYLFCQPPARGKSSKQLQLSSLKSNCSLFSRLYIASQTCNGDLDEFFKHENQAYPPSLSLMGVLRTGMKSDLLHSLMDLAPVNENVSGPTVQVNICDNAAIINMLQPETVKTFQNYATDVLSLTSLHSYSMFPDWTSSGMYMCPKD